jgi:hypothetical protein
MIAAEAVTFPVKVGSRVRSALVSTTLVVTVAVLGAVEPREWVAWLLLVSQLPMAVIRWLVVREALRRPWALRIDELGVWWSPNGSPMPWASLARIEVHQAHGLHRLLPHWHRVLLVNHAEADFARRANTRPGGRSVLLDEVRATPQAVVAACRRFTDAPAGLRLR